MGLLSALPFSYSSLPSKSLFFLQCECTSVLISLCPHISPCFSHFSTPLCPLCSVNARDFFLSYRTVDVRPDEVISSVLLPFATSPFEFVLPFKQVRSTVQ